MSVAPSDSWERRLVSEGLGALDFDDGAGGIKVGNKGSGKLLDSGRAFLRASAAEEREQRRVLLSGRYKRQERRVVQMWATGLSTRVIARRTGMGRMAVYRLVKRISRRIKLTPEMRLGELLSACEPTAIVLVFALLERALEAPGAIRLAMGRARAIPEIRALLEPDDVRLSLDKGDGHRHLGMNGPAGGSMLRSMDGTGGYRRDGWVSTWHKEKRRG